MSISSARLLAHHCCICLLLSVIISFTLGTRTRTTPSISGRPDFENSSSQLDSSRGKCQFNLTDSSHSLEANSSTYQHRGFSQCEYIIQAPRSRFILLNFTDIRSHPDMIVESGEQRQHIQQEATPTTTPITESQFSKILLRKPINVDKNVNNASVQSHLVDQPLSTVLGTKAADSNFTNSKSPHNSSIYNNSSGFHSANSSDSHNRHSVVHKAQLEVSPLEQELGKEHFKSNISLINKDTGSPSTARKGSYLELSTSSRSSEVDSQTDPIAPSHNCSLKLIIEEVNGTSGSNPQVICWGHSWQTKIPIVFQYSVPIRITYVWDRSSQSSFSLDFTFLRPEELDYCIFRCNNLCLLKNQLCDGHIDCPDHSDEHNNACALVNQQDESGEPHIIKVIVIIISVIVGVIIALALVLIFMINHCRCYDGAHRGGASLLQPPHSHSSEVCRSPSGSMQESGQYEPMLHQHPQQRQTAPPTLAVASSHCSEHQQLLHQHQPEVEQQQQQHRYQHHSSRNPCVNQHHYMSQEHQIRSLSSNAQCAVNTDNPRVSRPLQHQQQLQQKCVHYQQQQLEQQRQCKQAHKHVSPSELYPPNIPLSADGEEGYAMSQRALHSKQQLERNWQVENEVFRPPPNKTVYDRDSPPPPYSLNPPGTKSLDSLVPPVGAACDLRQTRSSLMHQGSPTGVPRSHSLSCHH